MDVFCEDELHNCSQHGTGKRNGERNCHLLNYSSVGKTIIWLSPTLRETMEMIKWLDEVTPEIIRWYLFKIEAIKVGQFHSCSLYHDSPSQEAHVRKGRAGREIQETVKFGKAC